MKTFTTEDIDNAGSLARIACDRKDLIDSPLFMHDNGLQETASGYGRKLTTRYMIDFNGKNRRIYCCIFSNCGTCYIMHKGDWLVIDAM